MFQWHCLVRSPLDDLLGPSFSVPKTFKNEDEAFQYIWNKTSTMRANLWQSNKVEKTDAGAEKFKSFGNKEYTSKEYEHAEKNYLQALCCAKYKGVTYGKTLYNLAFLRYDQAKYYQCIELINMCEKTEYPKNNFPKLNIRKMRAWKKLGDHRNAVETFERLKKLLRTLKLSESEQEKFLSEANEVLKEPLDKKVKKKHDGELILPEMEGNLTSKAEIRKGGERGSIVLATENIKLGEPILIEQMHVTNVNRFCTNCYSPNEVPHSCEKCIMVLYCSENCKKADAETHKLQCILYQTESFFEVASLMREPFVVFTKGHTLNGFHDFKAFCKDFKTYRKTLVGCSVVVHQIIQNKQMLKLLVDKNIVRSGLDVRQMAFEMGKKLLELAVILKLNREPFFKITYENYSFFPQYISFRHSCAPNTSKYFSGNKIVLKAAEDIEAGQEISVAYGSLLYINVNNAKRQEELQKYYGFKCQCKACQNLCLEAELTGVIKCERCRSYMRFETDFVFCENCSSAKRLDSDMRKIANLLSTESHISDSRPKLVETIERFKELEINPSNNTVVVTHLKLAINEINQGNVGNAMKIVVRTNALKGPFNKYIYCHHSIFRTLQAYLKTLHSTANRHRITEKIDIETVDIIDNFLNVFESLINLYYPKRHILEGIEEVRKYLLTIKKIYTIYNDADKLEWNIVSDDDGLRKTVQLPSH